MTIHDLPATDYVTMPWKNGSGSTDEICLLPAGASREAFELRVSRATIAQSGSFSSFPGVERTITLIEGHGLLLDFGDRTASLLPEQPYTFDSGLTPVGTPDGGVVRVLNVMAARNVWLLQPASVLCEAADLRPEAMGMMVVFAVRGSAKLSDEASRICLGEGDSALLEAPARLKPRPGSAILTIPLSRVAT